MHTVRFVYTVVLCLIMAELSQRQQDRISKSSTDRLRSQLVRSGMEEEEGAQMARGDLKAAAAQVEVECWDLASVVRMLSPNLYPTTAMNYLSRPRSRRLNHGSTRYSK